MWVMWNCDRSVDKLTRFGVGKVDQSLGLCLVLFMSMLRLESRSNEGWRHVGIYLNSKVGALAVWCSQLLHLKKI